MEACLASGFQSPVSSFRVKGHWKPETRNQKLETLIPYIKRCGFAARPFPTKLRDLRDG